MIAALVPIEQQPRPPRRQRDRRCAVAGLGR